MLSNGFSFTYMNKEHGIPNHELSHQNFVNTPNYACQ